MTHDHTTTRIAGEALEEARTHSERQARLFERIVGRVHRYFYKMVRDPDQAEDLAQETLLRLEVSLREKRYDPIRSFNTWLWIHAHTVWAQWCRRRETRRAAPLPEETIASRRDPADPDRAAERLDAETVLSEVERQLGPEVYESFVLYYQGGLTQREVGEVLGRNRKTIAERIAKAHRLIDRLLGRASV